MVHGSLSILEPANERVPKCWLATSYMKREIFGGRVSVDIKAMMDVRWGGVVYVVTHYRDYNLSALKVIIVSLAAVANCDILFFCLVNTINCRICRVLFVLTWCSLKIYITF